jgi:hypothetical protein
MSSSGQGSAFDHIPPERLREIAKHLAFFTSAEFMHIQMCKKCFNVWKRHVETEKDQDSDDDSNHD